MSNEPNPRTAALRLQICGSRALERKPRGPAPLRVTGSEYERAQQRRSDHQRREGTMVYGHVRDRENCCGLKRRGDGRSPASGPLRVLEWQLPALESSALEFGPAKGSRS